MESYKLRSKLVAFCIIFQGLTRSVLTTRNIFLYTDSQADLRLLPYLKVKDSEIMP